MGASSAGHQGLGAAARQPALHCLLAFEATARTLSVTKAAGELRVSAAAIGQSIALLEHRLGLKLVRSLSPVVELTGPGHRYFDAVQVFERRLSDALHARLPDGRARLRVSAAQALSRLWLAPRLASFAAQHPRIELVVSTTDRVEMVAGGGVDVGLRLGSAAQPGLVGVPLWTDRFVAAAAPALAARAHGLSPAELAASLPLIDHPVASWGRWLPPADGPAAPVAPVAPVLTCSDLHLAIHAACGGLGVVLSPQRLIEHLLAGGALQRVGHHDRPAPPYQAVVSPEQFDRAPVQAFLGWLARQSGAPLQADGGEASGRALSAVIGSRESAPARLRG